MEQRPDSVPDAVIGELWLISTAAHMLMTVKKVSICAVDVSHSFPMTAAGTTSGLPSMPNKGHQPGQQYCYDANAVPLEPQRLTRLVL